MVDPKLPQWIQDTTIIVGMTLIPKHMVKNIDLSAEDLMEFCQQALKDVLPSIKGNRGNFRMEDADQKLVICAFCRWALEKLED